MILRGVVLTLLLFALVQVNALSLEDVLLPGCKYGMQGYAPPNFNLCEWSHYLQFIILVFFMILGIGAVGTIILVVFYVLRKFGRCGNQFPTTSYTLTGKRLFSAVYVTFSLLVVFACFSGIVFSIMYAAGAGMLITTAFNVVKDTVDTIQTGSASLSSTSGLIDAFAGDFNSMSTGIAQAKAAAGRAESDLLWLSRIYGNMSTYSSQTNYAPIIANVINNNKNLQTLTTDHGFNFNASNPLSIFPLDMNSRYPLQASLDRLNYGLVDQPTDSKIDDDYKMPHGKAIAAVLTQTQTNKVALEEASKLTEGTIRDVVNVYVNFRNSVNKTAGASFQLGNLQDYITSGNVEGGYRTLLAFFAIFFILGFLGVGIAYVVFTVFGVLRSGRATKVGACCSFSLVFWAFVYAAACLFIFMIFSPYCSYKTEIFDPNRLTVEFQAQYPNYTSALNVTYGLMKCQGQTTILDVMSRITNGPPLTQQSAQFFTAINESIRISKPLPNSAQYSWDTYTGVLANVTIYNLYTSQQDLSTKFAKLQVLFGTVPTTTPAPAPTTAAPNASSTTPLPTTTLAPQTHNLTSMQELLQQVNDYGNYYPYFDVHIWDNWAIEITSYTRNLSIDGGKYVSEFYNRANVSKVVDNTDIDKADDTTIKNRLIALRDAVRTDTPKYNKVTQFQADFGTQYRALNASVTGVTLFASVFLDAATYVNSYAVSLNGNLNALNLGVKQIATAQTPLQQNAAGLYSFINQLSTAKCSNIGDSMNVVNYEICSVMNTALVFVGLSSFLVGLFCFILYPIALMAAKRFTGNTVDDDIDSLHRRADALAQRTTGKLRLRM